MEDFPHSPINRLPNLILYRLKNIKQSHPYDQLHFMDAKRLDTYMPGDIFGEICVLWTGETPGENAVTSFNGVKVSVRRLLYHNYIADITGMIGIKTRCKNKLCCTIEHLY